jgi:uncharacterized protein DUF4864
MDEPPNPLPPEPVPESPEPADILLRRAQQDRARFRRTIVRRLAVLLATAITAFVLTIWLLVRHEPPGGVAEENSAAAGVVRAQLDALGHGELRAAYDLFSDNYRKQVPFDAFHELVATHWSMFRAREIKVESREASRVRAVFDTHILSSDGERYLARYTVVEVEGRWWIDDVRWGLEPESRHRLTAQLQRTAAS